MVQSSGPIIYEEFDHGLVERSLWEVESCKRLRRSCEDPADIL
jgi:hypothetical protein